MTLKRDQPQKVVIIVPTYNEEACIKQTIRQLFSLEKELKGFELELLIFDSASTDATKACVLALQEEDPRIHWQEEPKKTGLGSAYLQAMHYAIDRLKADIIFEFDADLSHQPKYIPFMLEAIKDADVVLGSRYVKGGSIPQDWGWHRKLFSILGNYVARFILTPKYKDFTSGFRATRARVLKAVLPKHFLSNHYAYKLQLLWLLHQAKAKIIEIPIDFIDREQGLSKLPKNSVLDSLRVVFILRYQKMQSYLKMCLVGLSGIGVQCLTYNLLRFYLPPFSASQWAVSLAIVNNFILNSQFTFKQNQQRFFGLFNFRRLGFFIIYSLLMVYLQSAGLELGVNYLGKGLFWENLVLFMGIFLGSFLNYFVYSSFIWKEKSLPNSGSS